MYTSNKNIKILIIDDEIDARESLKNILERKGYSVLTAENGLDGLKKVRENPIDIIYCDIVMPEMDGLEFLENFRKFNLRSEVIMVTASSTVERCIAAIENNACAYLTKPVQTSDILDKLSKAAKRIEEKKQMLKTAFSAKLNN